MMSEYTQMWFLFFGGNTIRDVKYSPEYGDSKKGGIQCMSDKRLTFSLRIKLGL